MNKAVTTATPTHKCMQVVQREIFPMTAHFYSGVLILILNLNSKSSDELKPHLCVIVHDKLQFNKLLYIYSKLMILPF